MNAFEKTLRLLLDLHALERVGEGDSAAADEVRDNLDIPFGWCSSQVSPEERLTESEVKVINAVSAKLFQSRMKS